LNRYSVMKATIVVLACLAVVAFAQPPRPVISETFEGEGYSHIVTVNETIWGLGRWVIDEPKGHALEFWEFVHEHRHHSVHLLKRFDLGFEYAVNWHGHPTPHQVCRKVAVKPPMPPAWSWLKEAQYHGKHAIDGTTYDVWRHHVAGIELEVAVSEHEASRPHYFTRRTPSEHRVYHFISWHHFAPNSTWFNVPDVCKNATDLVEREEESMPGSGDQHTATCAIAASNAARIVEQQGFDAASMVVMAMKQASIEVPSTLWGLQQAGTQCIGGPKVGDVFFDGVPATSAAVVLGTNSFAECSSAMGAKCSIVEQRDFTGGCRRYC